MGGCIEISGDPREGPPSHLDGATLEPRDRPGALCASREEVVSHRPIKERAMPLNSRLFKGEPKLEACLISDPAHVVPGARGKHVGLIQQALVTLGAGVIAPTEIASTTYG